MSYDVPFETRPLDSWPEGPEPRPGGGVPSPFRASLPRTLQDLDVELRALGARNVRLLVAMDASDFRLDGRPRAHAKARHPGIVLSFDSRHGPLKYAVGTYSTWQDNLRAIALGLKALRAVDRYGITKRGEQYRGFKALPPGADDGFDSPAAARAFLRELTSASMVTSDRDLARSALARTHPDRGGDAETFRRVVKARELLEGGTA